MRLTVRHVGFVRGQPRRYHHVGEMPTFMETRCDIREMASGEAPVVATLTDTANGRTMEYRRIDDTYVRPLAHGPEILDIARKGAVGLGVFGGDIEVEYKHRAEWPKFASRCVGRSVDPRELHEWNATDIDDTDVSVFGAAVRDVLGRIVLIDGRMWENCYEPCMTVRWKNLTDGKARGVVAPGDVSFLHGAPGVASHNSFGLRVTLPTALHHIGEASIMHERCFSLNELDRISNFTETFRGGFEHADVTAERLVAVDASLCSPDFDALELGRSARLQMASWMAIERELTKATKSKWKKIVNVPEFDSRSAEIEFALKDFENNNGSPDELLDAMKDLQRGLQWVAGAAKGRLGVDVSAWLAPAYYGDPDNMAVELDIAGASLSLT